MNVEIRKSGDLESPPLQSIPAADKSVRNTKLAALCLLVLLALVPSLLSLMLESR